MNKFHYFEKLHTAYGGKKRKSQKAHAFDSELNGGFEPNQFCLNLLDMTMPDWMPDRLRRQARDALRGFSDEMALEITDNLVDCWTYGLRHNVGIDHVDRLLNSLYNRILYCANQKGIELVGDF